MLHKTIQTFLLDKGGKKNPKPRREGEGEWAQLPDKSRDFWVSVISIILATFPFFSQLSFNSAQTIIVKRAWVTIRHLIHNVTLRELGMYL